MSSAPTAGRAGLDFVQAGPAGPGARPGQGRPVVVAVLTYRRPGDLAQLLPQLVEQAGSVDRQCRVLVVDNDPLGGAGACVRAVARQAPVEVQYVREPRPGIAAGRNRALDEARTGELLVFVDDDERPAPGWLPALLDLHGRTGATGVVGPVVSSYAVEPDAWVRAGRFFDRLRWETGTQVAVAATNNLLLDVAEVRRMGLRFDDRFGLAGGSDTLFTRQLVAGGGRLVWCDEAVVEDRVPAERLTRAWVLRRAYRSGNSWALTTVALAPTGGSALAARARLAASGLLRAVGGAAKATAGALTGDLGRHARGLRTAARGAGMLAGTCGGVYSEYDRTGRSAV